VIRSSGSGVALLVPSGLRPLKLEWRKNRATTRIFLSNSSNFPQTVSFGILLQDRLGRPLPVDASSSHPNIIDPHSKQLIPLILKLPSTYSALPALGYLRVKVKPVLSPCLPPAKCRPVENSYTSDQEIFIPERPGPGLAGQIFLGSLITSALVVFVIGAFLSDILLKSMGSPNWNFQRSWAANAAIASSLLATILTLSIFPEHPQYMTKGSYSLLSSLFAALVTLAPLAYGLFHRGIQTAGADPQGYVATFLIAGGLVLWGALGQALTLWSLFTELVAANAIDSLVGNILQWLAAIFFLTLIVYGLTSLYTTAKNLSTSPPGKPNGAAALAAPPVQWPFL
jgi:hypothetical protein